MTLPGVALLLDVLDRDLALCAADSEFPITSMTRALAHAIAQIAVKGSALDVGTGSGVHAMLMSTLGYRPVRAIDASEQAVRCARSRGQRLAARLGVDSLPTFDHRTLDDNQRGIQYQLISFNPPAYLPLRGESVRTPRACGVYVDDPSPQARPESSALCRFFRSVVVPSLAVGGHVVCCWPGLERRVVENPSSPGEVQHPLALLTGWLPGFRFRSSFVEDAESFFGRQAVVSGDYGLGTDFAEALRARRHSYSSFVRPSESAVPLTFRFGILCLQRTSRREFELVPLAP